MNVQQAARLVESVAGSVDHALRAYICVGGSVARSGRLMAQVNVGVDLVWDLWNEQFSAFGYTGSGLTLSSSYGASASTYAALAFGRFDNVHQAWSGRFDSIGVSAAIPGLRWGRLGFSAGLAGFTSPGGTLRGVATSLTLSRGIPLPIPVPADLTVATGLWTPFDPLTRALSRGRPLHQYTSPGRRGPSVIVGLERGILGVSSHMGAIVPDAGGVFANLRAYAIAVSVLKSSTHGRGLQAHGAQPLRR
jgi:hypothetical protein